MDYNLQELLELALRVPEIGAVNFNFLYIILKSLIRVQGLEETKPDDLFQYDENVSETEKSIDSQGVQDLNTTKESLEENINELNGAMNELKNKIADMEKKLDPDEFEIDPDQFGKGYGVRNMISDIQSLKISRAELATKVHDLEKDFEASMDGYSKYGLHIDTLEKDVHKMLYVEDDVVKLKDQVEKLEDMVHIGGHITHTHESSPEPDRSEKITPSKSERVQSQDFIAEILASSKRKKAKEFDSAAKILEVEDKTPSNKFLEFTATEIEEENSSKFKEAEKASDSEEVATSDHQKMDILAKMRGGKKGILELSDEDETEIALDKNIEVQSKQAEVKPAEPKSTAIKKKKVYEAGKEIKDYHTILLFEILDEHSQKIKEEFIVYIKKQVDPVLNELYMVESDMNKVNGRINGLKYQIEEIADQPIFKNSSFQLMEDRLFALENTKKYQEHLIRDLYQQLNRKAEMEIVNNKAETDQLRTVENKLLNLWETASSNITILENLIKESVTILRKDLSQRMLVVDFEVYLEPMENKIKKLERLYKEFNTKSPTQHFHNIRPIEIKPYVHGGNYANTELKNEKWYPSSPESLKSYEEMEDNIPAEIHSKVQQKLEDAAIRDSKHIVEGAYTKIDFRRKRNL